MERLEKAAPSRPLSEAQKQKIAEIEQIATAKRAERKVLLEAEITKARLAGDWAEEEKLRQQLARDLLTIDEEAEAKKAKVRQDPSAA